MKLLANRILVTLGRTEEKSTKDGDIFIPEHENNSKFKTGLVSHVGNGNMPDGSVISLTVSVGDEVMLPRMAGSLIEIENKEYLLTTEAEIAIIL